MTATASGKVTLMLSIQERIPVGGARNLRTTRTGTHGGITVSIMTQTGTALTTSDRARNSSTLQTETSGRDQTMVMTAMTPPLQRRPWGP